MYMAQHTPLPMPPTGNPHIQRGFVLADLLAESVGQPNHSQHMATALTSLGEALEWQLDAWTIDDENMDAPPSCLVKVLFATTSTLFRLIHVSSRQQFQEVYENILHCSIQFLRHSEADVRFGAMRVLEDAWMILALSPKPFASVLLTTLRSIDDAQQRSEWKHILGMLCRASPPFAKKLCDDLAERLLKDHCLVAVLSSNQPCSCPIQAVEKAIVEASTPHDQALSLAASLIASRQSYYFDESQSLCDRFSCPLV